MKIENETKLSSISGTRRGFLKTTSLLAFSTPAAIAAGQGRIVSQHFEFLAEGVIDPRFVLPPPDVELPPGIEFRLRNTFPIGRTKNVLALQVFLAPAGLPVPLAEAPPLSDSMTISYFEIEMDDLQIGTSPVAGSTERLPSFSLSGKTISNPVISPFGDLTGAPSVVWSSFQITDPTTGAADFVFLGGATAGNHATVAPTGKGFLRLGK